MNHYDTLGVPKDADQPAIERAYRKKAQKAHPDKGGNMQQFHPIQRAYDVLSDAARRARYDSTGEEQPQDTRTLALGMLGQMFLAMVDKADAKYTNFVEALVFVFIEHLHHLGVDLELALGDFDVSLLGLDVGHQHVHQYVAARTLVLHALHCGLARCSKATYTCCPMT